MHAEFSGEIWTWRGPAPFSFITVADEEAAVRNADEGDAPHVLMSIRLG